MCYHPVKIRNPAIFVNTKIDKPFIEVPCGKCEECIRNRSEELVTRAYYEWRRCVANGGFSYFDTLTYRPSHLPIFRGYYVFSRKHLTDFLKRLRIALQRDGFEVTKEVEGKKVPLLRYLITSEYGDNTKKPHYHVIWFVNIPGLTLFRFYHFVRKCWQHGFNDKITDVLGHVVNRIDGIRYVCKYVTKDSDYYVSLYNKMLDEVGDEDITALQDIAAMYPNIRPFYRSSIGFGLDICLLPKELLITSGVPVGEADGKTFVKIPRYIRYKLFYDKLPHPFREGVLYRRNEFGVQYSLQNLDNVIDAKTLQLTNLLNNASLYGDIQSSLLVEQVNTLLDSRPLRKYVEYKVVYCGHLFSEYSFLDYRSYYEKWLNEPREEFNPFTQKAELKDFLRDDPTKWLDNPKHAIIDDTLIFNCSGFDEIDAIFDYLKENRSSYVEKANINKEKLKTRMHEVCTRFGLVT